MTSSAPRPLSAAIVFLVIAILVSGCGDDSKNEPEKLTVSAASSLQAPFEAYVKNLDYVDVALQFAASDQLAAQIRKGTKPDVFAASNQTIPTELYEDGLLEKPVPFATNQLVIAVPAEGSSIQAINDLTDPDVAIAVGSETVPIGSYARKAIAKLPPEDEQAVLDNFESVEPDVKGVVGKITSGAADAGFVYATDVLASEGKLKALALPAELEPEIVYDIAIVEGSEHHEAAERFIDGLVSTDGQTHLTESGFGPAPR